MKSCLAIVLQLGALIGGLCLGFDADASRPIRINVDSVPSTLDPPKILDISGVWIVDLLAERLIESHRSGQIKGSLAKKWTLSESGTVYTFTIRTDSKFNDGTALTVDDVIYSLKESQNRAAGYLGSYGRNIDSVERINEATFKIKLKKPMQGFLSVLGESAFSIFKKCKESLCFSGSFDLVELNSSKVRLKRRSDGQIFDLVVTTPEAAIQKFKSKEIEVLRVHGLTQVDEARKASAERLILNDASSFFFALNTARPAFSSAAARTQFANAIKRKSLENYLMAYNAPMSRSFLSPSFTLGKSVLSIVDDTGDKELPVEARKQFSKTNINVISGSGLESVARVALDSINPQLNELQKPEFLKQMVSGDYDAIILGYGYGSTIKDLDLFTVFFHSSSPHNFARINDPLVDQKIESMWTEHNPKLRLQIAGELLKMNQKNHWYVPLGHAPLIFALSGGVKYSDKQPQVDLLLSSSNLDLNRLNWR